VTRLAWRWRYWRARHYVWAADVEYRRSPTPANGAAWARAVNYCQRLEARRP
jgi:hypothetical protein